MTAKELILHRLSHANKPLALHELNLNTVSQAAASARLREMARDNLVASHKVPGKRYTAWTLNEVSDIDFSKPYWVGDK